MADLPGAEGIDGHSTAGLIRGDDSGWKDEAIVDFTSAGSTRPWRAVRQGRYKYVNVHGETPLLFDLENDPDEWHNLAGQGALAAVEANLRARSEEDWDPAAIDAAERLAQQERIIVQSAHDVGAPVSWDCQPLFDASKQHTR